MVNSFNIGECPICRGRGRLEILYDFKNNMCCIMCDECCAEWNTPEDALNNVNGFRKTYKEAEARNATREEIEEAGWAGYVVNWIINDP